MKNGKLIYSITLILAAIFLSVLVFLFFLQIGSQQESDLVGLSNFEKGQYYFNYTNDPSGEYDLKLARKYYELAVEEDMMQHYLLWYQLGRIDFIEGRLNAAIHKFNRQVDYFGDEMPSVYYMLGLAHAYNGRDKNDKHSWELATKNFKTFINYSYDSAWPRVDLAWVYFSQGKFEEMGPVLEEIIEKESDNPWVLNMYGLFIMNTADDKVEALPYFKKAQAAAATLSTEDWGKVYPGNDPEIWGDGLSEFLSIIERNINLLE